MASPGFCAVDRVICVPWQGDSLKFHTAISGEPIRLKGVIKTTDLNSTIWYKWVYGDGSESAVLSLTGNIQYDVDTFNTYSGAVGTPFTARLVAGDDAGLLVNTKTDDYLVKLEQDNLDSHVNRAIDDGLWYLYKNRWEDPGVHKSYINEPVTVWRSHSEYYPSATASALLAFQINNHKESGNPDEDPYVEVVARGLNWLLTGYYSSTDHPMLRAQAIAIQKYGDPDTNSNGIGIETYGRYTNRRPYEGGMVMDAIIATGTPDADSGRDFDADGHNDTYKEIVQDMVDMYAWGQDDYDTGGGWRYSWNQWPDNSAAQWAAIGMIPAQAEWGCTIPDFVKTRNRVWLTTSYNSTYRMFGYTGTNWGNSYSTATRPSGMVQMIMSVPDYKTDTRWQACEAWFADSNPYRGYASSWDWFIGRRTYYGWYAFVKAMRLSRTEILSNGFNWYRGSNGIAEKLINEQQADGSWADDYQVTHPGYYGEVLTAAWAVNMLKPSLFAASPVSCFTAEPNPTYAGEPVSFDPSCTTHSETGKDIANIVRFEWDFDNDGIYDMSQDDPDIVSYTFTCDTLPCEYPVTLKVTDDEGLTSTYTLGVNITDPPHPPVADAGGPYIVSLSDLDSLVLDGSGSYEMDAGVMETGCTDCEGDRITSWNWDLTQPLTDFTNGSGQLLTLDGTTLVSLLAPGTHTLALRVTDNTNKAFPSSGQPDLTDVDFATIKVLSGGIRDLAARPKGTKCQLTWGHIGATAYKILRSIDGPNSGFVQIGTTTSTYSTFLDYNLTGDVVVENTCKGDLDGNEVVDEADAVIFTQAVGTRENDAAYNVAADFDDDGDVDGMDVVFFSAEFGRVGCMQETGIELNKDYWYRVETEMGGESILSNPVFVNSQGMVTNQPPVFYSDPVLNAMDGVAYQYDVQASDPEGEAVVFTLQMAPHGMNIDVNTGMITWTPDSDQIGPNDVLVKAEDVNGYASTQFFTIITGTGPNTAPSVDTGGPYTGGLVSQAIAFDGTGSFDPDGDSLISYHWIFGDGTDGYGSQVNHTYAGAGIYTITLHVEDSRGRTGHGITTCEIGNPNRPPIAFINGPATADAGTPITFSGSSSYDPDNDSLTYEWDFGGGSTAAGIEAVHIFPDQGTFPVKLSVNDGKGGSDSITIPVIIGPPNGVPVFGSPEIEVTGDLFNTIALSFKANASDPDGDYLEYSWRFGDGSSGSGQNVEHAFTDPGVYEVSVTISDSRGASISFTHSYTILQVPDRPPTAEANGPYQADLAGGSSVAVSLDSSGSFDPDGNGLTYEWAWNGNIVPGASPVMNFNTVGWHDVVLTATETTPDALSGTDTARVLIIDSHDTAAPTAIISTPDSSASTITDKINVTGTADDAEHFAGFILEISGEKDGAGNWINWTTLNEGINPVNNGVLGTIDPSILKNDFYRLRLRVSDGTQESSSWIEIKVAGELKFGNLKLVFNDLNIPVAGIPITITRTYDSFDRSTGDFGHGWTLDINKARVKEDVNHNVFITLPDGRRVAFAFAPVRLSPFFPGWDVRFMAPPGVHAQLDFVGDHMVNQSADGDWYWFSGLFNPDDYILKTKDGRTYEINQTQGIKKVSDRNGNQLTINQDGIIHSSGRSISFTRDAQGRIERITDPAGNQIDYTYDIKGDLVKVTYPEGYVMTFEYNDNHFITKATDPEGRAVQQNEYDESGRLVATINDEGARTTFVHDVDNKKEIVIDAKGHSSEADFNDHGLKTMEKDQLGNAKIWTYDSDQNIIGYEIRDPENHLLRSMGMEYDANGNPTKIVLPDGGVFINTFNEGNRMTSMTLPDGRSQTFEFDADYNLIRMADSLGHVSEYDYDDSGNRTSATDALGRTTHYTYDEYGHLSEVIDSCGEHHGYTYNQWGDILTYTRPDGAIFTHGYDTMGRRTSIVDPLGNSRLFEYDGRGNKTARIDENGFKTTYEYNSRDKITRTLYPDGSQTLITYDVMGNMTGMTDADGNLWSFQYDEAGRKISQTDPDGNMTRFEYDADGDVSAVIDAMGNKTTYVRDADGRIIRVIDALGGETSYEYDVAGNMTKHTDAKGHVNQFIYGDWYRLIKEIKPDGHFFTYAYDSVGNRIKRTDAAGQVTDYVYDNCNRLLSRIYPDGSSVDFGYDALGNRISMDDASGHTDYTYDVLNRITQVINPAGSLSYAYDSVGNITSITDPLGTTQKTYNSRNSLVSVRDRSSRITDYGFDTRGNLSSISYPNGINTSLQRNIVNRLTGIEYSNTGGPLGVSSNYTYDAVGNVLSRSFVSGETSSFEYDNLYRLVKETRGTGDVLNYSYDPVGNRLSETDDSGTLLSHTYNILDQMITRTYDLNGNMISDGIFDYEYDYENRLVSVESGGTQVAGYVYDGDGNRVMVNMTGGTSRTFLIDTLMRYPSVLVETDSAGSVTTGYTYGYSLISMERGLGNIFFYMHDNIGSTTGLSNGTGTITDTYQYDPFGNERARTGTSMNAFLFAGSRFDDESGLYHMRARQYDPSVGRFLSRDSANGFAMDPRTFHPYMYANQNPQAYIDPMGTQAILSYIATIANNPDQWMGAFVGGFGAGYTVNNLGFVSEVLKNAGKPMGQVIGNGLLGMLKQLTLLDCGQLAITLGIKDSAIGALAGLAHEFIYDLGNNAASGDWGNGDAQIITALGNFAVNIGKILVAHSFKAVDQIAQGAAIDGTFKAFDIGKTLGSMVAIYTVARSFSGVD